MADALAPWLGRGQCILDAGCGPGGNGAWLAQHGRVVGVDVAPEALAFVRDRQRALSPVQASIAALPFADRCFDVVVGVTVVYTVEDDVGAVRELARVLRPGGALLLLEPAFSALRRAHDATVHTVRRYRRAELASIAAGAGLRVEHSTYAYSFLAPAALGLAAVGRLRPVCRGRRFGRRAARARSRVHPARLGRAPVATTPSSALRHLGARRCEPTGLSGTTPHGTRGRRGP